MLVAIFGNLATSSMMKRREYDIRIKVNGRQIHQVIIDTHYEKKHAGSIDDRLILQLVRQLYGRMFEPDGQDGPYVYFVTDDMLLKDKKL